MKIYQLLATISPGDAVGNDVIALEKTIEKMGYKTGIYAEQFNKKISKETAQYYKLMPKVGPEDVVILHLSTGSEVNRWFGDLKCRKILVYHNVTPSEFFTPYNEVLAKLCEDGRKEMEYLHDKVDYCLAVSDYNKRELLEAGYTCPIDVLPILIPFDDYKKEPNKDIMEQLDDEYTNILFTGRIAPNKKQEDLIKAFYYYKKYYNDKARLILVGSYVGMENYFSRLKMYVEELELEDVIMTGHVPFSSILACYHVADVFLCQSEHEGFCVPLVEAMYFKLPIIAKNTSAIESTLGGSGILTDTDDARVVAGLIDKVVGDKSFADRLVKEEQERLKDFSHDTIEKQFEIYLKGFLERK